MLAAFIESNRVAIIAGSRARVALRPGPKPTDVELSQGIPMFLEHLSAALVAARSNSAVDHTELDKCSARHGSDLFHMGLTVGQVVHDYGDVCQVVTSLVVDQGAQIPAENFRTLNLCLDDAIAGAVTEYAKQREQAISNLGTERLGILAHEMRNALNTSMLSFDMIKDGRVAASGSTAAMHARSLMTLRDLIDRSLAEVRLDAGLAHLERILVTDFIAEIEIVANIQAKAKNVLFSVSPVEADVAIDGDRQVLVAALFNLLQNAFKFTHKNSIVILRTIVSKELVLFEVEDQCGGFPPGKIDELFLPFSQRGADRTGVGLGLSICMKAAKANGGDLYAKDLPGEGCIFTLSLPRRTPPTLKSIKGGKKETTGEKHTYGRGPVEEAHSYGKRHAL